MDDNQLKRHFIRIAKNVWDNSPMIENLELEVKHRKGGCHMSLAYPANATPSAVGNSLLRMPRKVSLIISDKTKDLPKEKFDDLLRHEALHLGYPRHDMWFRRQADKLNIPITFNLSEGGGYQVQRKEGSRYKTVKSFPTMQQAELYAKQLVAEEIKKPREDRKRIRMVY